MALTVTTFQFVNTDWYNAGTGLQELATQFQSNALTVDIEETRGRQDALVDSVTVSFWYVDPDTGQLGQFGSPWTYALPTQLMVKRNRTETVGIEIPQNWFASAAGDFDEDDVPPIEYYDNFVGNETIFRDAVLTAVDQLNNSSNPQVNIQFFADGGTVNGFVKIQVNGSSANGEALDWVETLQAVTFQMLMVTDPVTP